MTMIILWSLAVAATLGCAVLAARHRDRQRAQMTPDERDEEDRFNREW